jgi:NAD(P)-dependent dehydrogenase (short-subunit alcohol dehydrogenase family)
VTAKRLAGVSVLITGASKGIGALTGQTLLEEGARAVVSLSRSAPSAASGIKHVPCDVTRPESVNAAVAPAIQILGGPPDILINNAGIFQVGKIGEMSVDSFTAIVGTNLFGPFHVLSAFLGGMRTRGSGHVVTIGSIADRVPFQENGAYSAAKYGLRGLMEVLRTELRGSGIRSTVVSPTSVDTTIWDPVLEGEGAKQRFPERAAMLRAEDVVAAILFALTLPARANVDELRLSRS